MKSPSILDIQQVTNFPRPGYRIPGDFRFSADKRILYFLYAEEDRDRALWAYDLASGTRQVVARAPDSQGAETFDDEMRRQRVRRRWGGIGSFAIAADVVMVPHQGKVYISKAGSALAPVVGADGIIDPSLSQDGRYVFGVVRGDMWVFDWLNATARQLTRGSEAGLTYGLAEYVAQEELDRRSGYWPSPDSRFIVVAEVDERHMPIYPIVHQEARGVQIEEHRYPFVGQDNAHVRLAILALEPEESELQWLDWRGADRYLLDVVWRDSKNVFVLSLSFDHQHLAWDLFDHQGGFVRRVYEEDSPTWIVRPGKSYVIEDGTLVSTSERSGTRAILMVTDSGEWRLLPMDDGEEAVLDLLAVDHQAHCAYVWATRNRSLERTLARLDWVSGEWQDLTPEPGWHAPVVADDASAWVDVGSTREYSPKVLLHERDGEVVAVVADSVVSRADLGLVRPELFSATAEDGAVLNGLLYVPDGNAPVGGWPLIDAVYGGPMAQTVAEDWSVTVDLEAQYLVQRGFAVMRVDNRGSANRGREFERVLFHHFGEAELADQIAGVHYLAQRWPINLRRVGIYGWSYGGYMALRALFMAPELFRVGVAGAPVTDFRWYDTAYTERYLGSDENNHAGYESTSLINKAARLQGRLLLIHGMVDENVHFRHSAALIDAFIQADRDFDLLVLPTSRHMVSDVQTNQYRTRRILEYFEKHL